jgi:DNA primase large subunit
LPYDYSLDFVDYLRNTTHLRDKNWKLVNRPLSKGNVYLGKDEIVRLLKEEVQRQIDKRLEVEELPKFPPQITQIAEKMRNLAVEEIGKPEMDGFPKIVQQEAFPPCILSLYQAFTSGRHLSHIGRFALTTFLINIGMPTQTLIDLFRSFSDFNERMTRYQVEHLAGEKGSHTRYVSPKCSTLQTHGICISPGELCSRIQHPLSYYRRRSLMLKQQ